MEFAAIVYFHGGGFIVGSPLTHADITAALCRESGLPLYSVDYRLAPDFVAPAPVEDGTAVVAHLVKMGIRSIVLCGDSAGGAIALALQGRLPQTLRANVIAVCSFYGAHGRLDSPSLLARGNRAYGTDAACVGRYFTLANANLEQNIYSTDNIALASIVNVAKASPQLTGSSHGSRPVLRTPTRGRGLTQPHARSPDLGEEQAASLLPPCGGDGRQAREGLTAGDSFELSPVPIYLMAAGDDPLLDHSFEMAKALRARGRTVVTDVVEGMDHGFLHDADRSATAAEAMKRVAVWISDVARST